MWPNLPKIPYQRYTKTKTVGGAITVTPATLPLQSGQYAGQNELENWLLVDQPISRIAVPANLEMVSISGNGGGALVVDVADNAVVTIMEHWHSQGESLGLLVILNVGANAQVTYINDDQFHSQVAVIDRVANVGEHATLDWTVAGFNQSAGFGLLQTNLLGRFAKATVNVGALAAGKQHFGYTTQIENIGQKTVGHINQRGVITDSAHLIFNGIGHIVQGARGSDNQQENRVLMLSDGARGDANPLLLIDENDVTAGHAASVARVDANQLYYLMSRGLPKAQAQRMVIRGFLDAGLVGIDGELRQDLFAQIERTLLNGLEK
ncbi:SufD family Fe-S cluster assembly protein [Lacticaseibacillus brantae]|uniref:Fe-S cluster assembly ABC-type transport system, permease component n=1 Tax=Lacticaseibacillus brantae DSM 23927 TaxID=1423727 RepID=A0A0R2B126_9LACO|nr:SufD family Fe-S cluster assembly protein [Lacticaseibacillus brantae]KRM72927.1 Fe-S cluster assembly ABC-type transport system, permease component [Lacticaseibacillus brantae DSM 23927]